MATINIPDEQKADYLYTINQALIQLNASREDYERLINMREQLGE